MLVFVLNVIQGTLGAFVLAAWWGQMSMGISAVLLTLNVVGSIVITKLGFDSGNPKGRAREVIELAIQALAVPLGIMIAANEIGPGFIGTSTPWYWGLIGLLVAFINFAPILAFLCFMGQKICDFVAGYTLEDVFVGGGGE